MNRRLSPKERGIIKGAINRAFSRSELRKQVVASTRIEHSDPNRPRVKNWSECPECLEPTPTYTIEVDHVEPRIPLDSSFSEMTLDEYLDRTWCDQSNLKPLCAECHAKKTAREKQIRTSNKRTKKGKK